MNAPAVTPLPYRRRKRLFYVLLAAFIFVLPLLYLYATGYRFDFGGEQNIVSTGGLYVAASQTGAEIYINGELMRQTRVFRRAFYAQSLTPGTHRVHVQKEGHHTWVKELPVYPRLVTEARAFNLPEQPVVRIIAPRQTNDGRAVIAATATLPAATFATSFVLEKHATSTAVVLNEEFATRHALFHATTTNSNPTIIDTLTFTQPPEPELATTTVALGNVRLIKEEETLFAVWTGEQSEMPYYYCAQAFPAYTGTSTAATPAWHTQVAQTPELLHPVQTVSEDASCQPRIALNTKGETPSYFNFFNDDTDFVLLGLSGGIYVVEVDNRSWQNMQPLLQGEGLMVRTANGSVYAFDGELIYQIVL